jgi:hypothetical protein
MGTDFFVGQGAKAPPSCGPARVALSLPLDGVRRTGETRGSPRQRATPSEAQVSRWGVLDERVWEVQSMTIPPSCDFWRLAFG